MTDQRIKRLTELEREYADLTTRHIARTREIVDQMFAEASFLGSYVKMVQISVDGDSELRPMRDRMNTIRDEMRSITHQ